MAYVWRGKRLTLKQYNARLTRQKNGLKRKKSEESKKNAEGTGDSKASDSIEHVDTTNNPSETDNLTQSLEIVPGEGRRIVELLFLGEQMWCTYCREALSFQFIESETRCGLSSLLRIRCHRCLLENEVSTSKSHSPGNNRQLRYDVNTKSALGAIHSGLGWTHVDKFLSCMNVPCYDMKTFKRYEKEVGTAAEAVAKMSCENATELERQMTVERVTTIDESL